MKRDRKKNPRYRTWVSWNEMLKRCTDPRNSGYPRYGGRGIRVCDAWMNSFEAFLRDMGPRAAGTTIDRIDNDGNYEPGNCRWVDAKTQARNRGNNRLVTFKGETLTVTEWAQRIGIHPSTLAIRLRNWPVEEAMSTKQLPTGWSLDMGRNGTLTGRKSRTPEERGIDVCPARGCRAFVPGVDPAEVFEGSMFTCEAGHVLEAVLDGDRARLRYTRRRERVPPRG